MKVEHLVTKIFITKYTFCCSVIKKPVFCILKIIFYAENLELGLEFLKVSLLWEIRV